jgi:hypothetical protein
MNTYPVVWEVSVTDIVADVLRALGSHSSAQDVYSYGRDVLGVPWAYREVIAELEEMMADGSIFQMTTQEAA